MLETYIAVGFDPARFWRITPRLYAVEMRGAQARIKRERGLAWEAAMLGRVAKPPSFDDFIGSRKRIEPEQFLSMRLRAANKGMQVMTMEQWREQRGRA